MYVCLCKGITDQQIREKGQTEVSPKEVCKRLGVGVDCGICISQALDIINEMNQNHYNHSNDLSTKPQSR